MKTRTYYLSILSIKIITSILFINSIAVTQSGRMGFSSVVTDKSSTGNITNASSEFIEDSHQNWPTNTWTGYYIYIASGNCAGQVHKIIGNTATTINISPTFSILPNVNSSFIIREGYKEATQSLELKIYMQYNDGNRSGGKFFAYSCRIQASDTTSVEFVSVEQGNNLSKSWAPTYFVPSGKGQVNWMVLPMSEGQSLASGVYNIATVTVNLLRAENDKLVTFYITNCPEGGLPIGSSEDRTFFFFDTTSSNILSGRNELLVLHNSYENDRSLAMGTSQSSGTINSYPNPFNPTTTIKYKLAEISDVHLVVFDMLGRSVGELVHTRQPEGMHAAAWEPHNVSSGTYFARLTIQGSISNTKEIRTLKLAYTK